MERKIILATIAGILVMFTILSVNVAQLRLDDTDLQNVKIMSQANAQVNPACPNGCLDGGAGCTCNGYHPHYLDYADYKKMQQH